MERIDMAHDAPPHIHAAKMRGVVEKPRARDNDRARAIRAMTAGRQTIYAIRLSDGVIKIGCTSDLVQRRRSFGPGAEILAFRFGDFEEESTIHAGLEAHRARGLEYYDPTPEVLAVVNEMRDEHDLPHL